ncbi:flagellar basal body P-ring protein FlgI [Chitinispirillales bacterium ANBcel5]|uniref:flagellar basal body P-ring protein FlgI n=1 Tax=Cellulosispirillum alkaliphilum TaxID=3039283 RepID=UPI002A57AF85|nr:flagellar basal body P-ring protein FlgI [Chitinispirillales bacterium ANBcel5]
MKLKAALVILFCVVMSYAQQEVRIKDVASVTGLQDVQLFGYGLVVGLGGTGDRNQTVFTEQTITNMLKNMGIELPERHIRVRNVAAVMVTGHLTPFRRQGTRIDVTVSSIGDASSLEGGTLIMTPLQGPDGQIYASAQGALATGGYDVRNRGISHIKRNHVLVGRIPDGAIIQNEVAFNTINEKELSLSLHSPDFTSAVSMARSINEQYGIDGIASPVDAATVSLDFAHIEELVGDQLNIIEFLSTVENMTFEASSTARVVINERTGTIVAGGNVRIAEIAVTHGGVKVEVVNIPEVVQPYPLTLGRTEVVPDPAIMVDEADAEMVVLDGTTTVSDLAQALNSLGVTPRDVIAILQAIKEAGALHGQLVIL